jgi:hypothetical protein
MPDRRWPPLLANLLLLGLTTLVWLLIGLLALIVWGFFTGRI